MKKRWLWLIPAGFFLLFIGFVAALPSLVASSAHRDTIEALASSLTGRRVHINGQMSLVLFPEPELVANQITIGGPDNETITAQSLTLDIAVTALLRGRLSASNLSLQSPVIALPWPLPGGAAAVAPPPWLTSLHAQIANGTIGVGALRFESVDADIFTGANGALRVSGTGQLRGQNVAISLSLDGLDPAGSAPVSIDAQCGPAAMHLSGNFNAASALSGEVSFTTTQIDALGALGQPANASAAINADPEQIELTKLSVYQGDSRLTGSATLALGNPILSLTLSGSGLTLPGPDVLAGWSATDIPTYIALDASGSTLAGAPIPHLAARVELSSAGADISALTATLPGNSSLALSGTADPAGGVAGRIALVSNDFSSLLAGFGLPVSAPDTWRQTSLTARVSGTLEMLNFHQIAGTLGPGYVTGTVLADRTQTPLRLAGALHFDTLDLTPFAAAAAQMQTGGAAADFEITADRAVFGPLNMTRLLIDASLGSQLTVRRVSASLYNGFLAASFTRAPNGDVSAARAVLSLPSAAPLAALLPPALQPPAAVTAAPLAAGLIAAGPANTLQTSATLTIGAFDLTASPVIDLTKDSASGPLTLRHPNAIAALTAFGMNAGLPWPGAGSISLRADMLYSPTQFGFRDFVVSLGDLTASGQAQIANGNIVTADIQAGTLALPPWPADLTPAWSALAGASGKIALAANRVTLAGAPILGPSAATITLTPGQAAATLTNADLAGGTLTASLNILTPSSAPPQLSGQFSLASASLAQINLPTPFPLTVPAGTLAAQGKLSAAGYGPQAWIATLAGTASLSAKTGTLTGFDLKTLTASLNAQPPPATLQTACQTGTTTFTTLAATGTLNHGIYTLTAASLQSPDGSATATGNIDLPDQDISLNLALLPNVPTPPTIGLSLNGPWQSPQKTPATRDALAWLATGVGK